MSGPIVSLNLKSQSQVQMLVKLLEDDGSIPNNEKLPLLVYQKVIRLEQGDPASQFEDLFAANGWEGSWRNGVFGFHHYHSTAHEVLGCYSGSATVQFGGERGITVEFGAGDVVVIPAGVGHKNLGARPGFGVVGAYPRGQTNDMGHGKPDERPRLLDNIAAVPLPNADPVYGDDGILQKHWYSKS